MSRLFPWLVLALGVVVVVATHRDFGPTPDEGVQATYGELALRYFASGGADTACNEYLDLRFYGPLVEMLSALFYDPAVGGKYEVRHLVLGLLSLLVIPGVWLYARISGLPGLPFFAVLAVVALPRFFGHWFNNSKDMPFALAVTWFMIALAWVVRDPGWRWRQVLVCAATMGLALCVRPGGFPILLLFLLAAVAIGEVGARRVDPYRSRAVARRSIVGIAARVALVPLLAWVVMVLPWPWAHQAPIANPIEAMRVATEFPTTMPVLFEGITWNSDELPWYYLPKYVIITTPLPILLLALAGLLFGLRLIVRERSSVPACSIALTLVWLLVPLALFAIFTPNVYGGMRHFLFVWPAIAILAGHGAAAVWRAASPENRLTTAVALSVMTLLPVRETVRLHPYQIAYYNALVGGVGGASDKYWTDYPMSSYKEAIEWVNEQNTPASAEPLRVVLAAGEPVMLWARDYAAANVELIPLSNLPPELRREGVADYFIGTTRLGTDGSFPKAPIVHTIGRGGAVFTVIRKLP
jgi:hypothetical protein